MGPHNLPKSAARGVSAARRVPYPAHRRSAASPAELDPGKIQWLALDSALLSRISCIFYIMLHHAA